MIEVVVINLVVLDLRERAKAAGFVEIGFLDVVACLLREHVVGPQEGGDAEVVGLVDAPAEWVVFIGDGFVSGGGVDADQLILQVIVQDLLQSAVFATRFFDQVATGVVIKVFVTLQD